jgi:FkbM family methyltransferase
VVGRHVYIHGDFEAAVLRRVYGLLPNMGSGDGTLIDIGANIGTTCVQALVEGLATTAIAVEPEPGNFALLERNIRANGLEGRITPLRLALSDREGTAELELSPDNSGDHRVRLSSAAGAFGEAMRTTTSVTTSTFDALVEQGTIDLQRTGLVWMDVQGHEGQVLAGATKLVASDVRVVLEYWPYGIERAGGQALLDGIIRDNYRWFVDVRNEDAAKRPTSEIGALADSIVPPYFTDLLLLKK